MKVFIAGSKSITELPQEFTSHLDSLIADEAQFLIGDSWGFDDTVQRYIASKDYRNVDIYCIGYEPKCNHGNWHAMALRINPLRRYHQKKKDVLMAEDVDLGLIVWDGVSKGTFIDIAMLLMLGKALILFISERQSAPNHSQTILRMSSLGELKEFISGQVLSSDDEEIEKVIEDAISVSVPSASMADHIRSKKPSIGDTVHILVHSPIPITLKIEHLRRLAKYDDSYLEAIDLAIDRRDSKSSLEHSPFLLGLPLRLSAKYNLDQSVKALRALALKDGEYIQAIEAWYDEDSLDEKESTGEFFWTTEAAFDWLHQLMIDEEWDSYEEELLCWTVFKKWSKGNNGQMRNPYTYYLIDDEIVFFDKNTQFDTSIYYHSWRRDPETEPIYEDIDISLPFELGTILEIDCTPFAPTRKAVLIEKSPHGDHACSTAIYFDPSTKLWSASSMGGWFWKYGIPRDPGYSVIYKLKESENVIPEYEQMFLDIKDFISKNPKLGNDLYTSDIWYQNRGLGVTEEVLREHMAKLLEQRNSTK